MAAHATHAHVPDARSYTPPPALDRLESRGLLGGLAGLVVLLGGGALSALHVLPFDLSHVFRAYLVGFMLWTGISVGSLSLMMLHHLSGGGWGVVLRRIFEAATRVLPLLAGLFIPVAGGMFPNNLYPRALPPFPEGHAAKPNNAL